MGRQRGVGLRPMCSILQCAVQYCPVIVMVITPYITSTHSLPLFGSVKEGRVGGRDGGCVLYVRDSLTG